MLRTVIVLLVASCVVTGNIVRKKREVCDDTTAEFDECTQQ